MISEHSFGVPLDNDLRALGPTETEIEGTVTLLGSLKRQITQMRPFLLRILQDTRRLTQICGFDLVWPRHISSDGRC